MGTPVWRAWKEPPFLGRPAETGGPVDLTVGPSFDGVGR